MAYVALPYVASIAFAVTLLVRLVPEWRKTRPARIITWASCGVVAIVVLVALPMLSVMLEENVITPIHEARLRRYSGDRPREIAGVLLPPNSYVQLDDEGRISYGRVSSPTIIYGMPLVGEFSVEEANFSDDGQPFIGSGTFAKPFSYRGIPCAAAAFDVSQIHTLTCTLAQETILYGIPLRGGSRISVYLSRWGKQALKLGVLGRQDTYYGVDWPAGTQVEDELGTGVTAEILQGLKPGSVSFTLPSGNTRRIEGRSVPAGIPIPFKDGNPDLSMLDIFLRLDPK